MKMMGLLLPVLLVGCVGIPSPAPDIDADFIETEPTPAVASPAPRHPQLPMCQPDYEPPPGRYVYCITPLPGPTPEP